MNPIKTQTIDKTTQTRVQPNQGEGNIQDRKRNRDVDQLHSKMKKMKEAQKQFATFSQTQVDAIFQKAARAANMQRIGLAKIAVSETQMGILEDKVIKNHYASEFIYHAYKDTQTCGIVTEDAAAGYQVIAEPIGLIAAVIPTTNPTSTAIFKALLALKTRNAIIFSPHPRAKKCTVAAAKVVHDAAVAAGAPEGVIGWIDEPSLQLTQEVMQHADLILATGGPGMVKAAYASGKPAIGVGAGNVPAIIDRTADIKTAVNSILLSKTFDNGMICASEQAVIVDATVYDQTKAEFAQGGCHFLSHTETEKVRQIILIDGALNAKIVGQSAAKIARMADVKVPEDTKILIGEVESVAASEAFAHEKLSPILAMYRFDNFTEALTMAERLVFDGGLGHTAVIHLDPVTAQERLTRFRDAMKTGRVLINTPSSQGGIGDLYNFKLAPSLTLGCGSWGGNSVSENVGVKHLLNYKTVAERKENMLWFRTPEKVYFKRGSLSLALRELKEVYNKKRVFIVTDEYLYNHDFCRPVTEALDAMGIRHSTFFEVLPDPTLASARAGAKAMAAFEPDCIIALGGGSAMDAAKIMWTLYEHPNLDFHDLAMRFMDIRKRVHPFPKMGEKAHFIAIPTSAGTGSEVTPFAVITDEETKIKYPLADYALMPHMAIVDSDLMMHMPPGLTAASGVDALTHAMEAIASMLASEFSDAHALKAIRDIFSYLPQAYEQGAKNPKAREKMAHASTMAGMAFANAFLGICHSMAHKLGATHDLPHGVANALLIREVMRYNASKNPRKMGTFSQYAYPCALERYAEVADCIGIDGQSDEEKLDKLLQAIGQLLAKVGIRDSIQAYGIKKKDFLASLDEMTEQAFDDQCTGANPRYPLLSEIKEIYLASFDGVSRK